LPNYHINCHFGWCHFGNLKDILAFWRYPSSLFMFLWYVSTVSINQSINQSMATMATNKECHYFWYQHQSSKPPFCHSHNACVYVKYTKTFQPKLLLLKPAPFMMPPLLAKTTCVHYQRHEISVVLVSVQK